MRSRVNTLNFLSINKHRTGIKKKERKRKRKKKKEGKKKKKEIKIKNMLI